MGAEGVADGIRVRGRTTSRQRWLAGAPVQDRCLEVAGVSTAYLEAGAGDPILLLHGQGGFGGMFLPVIAGLAAAHHVIVPDLPGLGASTVEPDRLDDDLVLRWLDRLIAATCDVPPVIVGHSLGGSIAARFAAAHPERLSRLVLADAGGLAGRVRPAPPVLVALIRFAVRPTLRNADRFSRRILFDQQGTFARMGPGRRDLFARYMVELASTRSVQAANRRLLKELGLPAIPPVDLARIRVPTTLVWGRHDPVMPVSGAAAASQRYGWPLHVIEAAGHVPHVEQPAAFLAILEEALSD